jgi:hypothetical protein
MRAGVTAVGRAIQVRRVRGRSPTTFTSGANPRTSPRSTLAGRLYLDMTAWPNVSTSDAVWNDDAETDCEVFQRSLASQYVSACTSCVTRR